MAAPHNPEIIDLDDLETRDAVAADPPTFVSGPAPVRIDEYQHVPPYSTDPRPVQPE
jgi:hypothetical protein